MNGNSGGNGRQSQLNYSSFWGIINSGVEFIFKMARHLFKENLNCIIIITVLFLVAIGIDISPFLRGPAPYPPEWQWTYLFINTLDRIYLPLICIGILLVLFWLSEKKNNFFNKHIKLLLALIIILSFLFQISVQFFSRAGVPVLIHRIINPELNGYFTAALPVENVADFLNTYNQNILKFVYHAKSHPPGAILLFFAIKQLMLAFPVLGNIAGSFSPAHADVKSVWDILLPSEKATAIFSAFLIPFISALSTIPLYYSTKILFGVKSALRVAFLFVFIPSVVLFIPINDSFLHIFAITAFFFMLKGIKQKKLLYISLSGLTLFLGLFFNLSLLPLVIFLGVFFLLSNLTQKKIEFKYILKCGLVFSLGFILFPLILYFSFHFDFIQMLKIIMGSVPDVHTRSYKIWIFYNLYDFFIFSGIPIAVVFFLSLKQLFRNTVAKKWKYIDHAYLAFFIMLIILNFSGSVRGETGRILVILMPFMALIAANFATNNLKSTTRQFGIFLALQALQILVMQEFWVMLW